MQGNGRGIAWEKLWHLVTDVEFEVEGDGISKSESSTRFNVVDSFRHEGEAKFPLNFLKLNECRIPLSLFFFFFSLPVPLMLLLPFFFFADDDDGDFHHVSILPPANHSVRLLLTKPTPAFQKTPRLEPHTSTQTAGLAKHQQQLHLDDYAVSES